MTGFSIIIPAHNEEQFLPQCLAGVKSAATQLSEEVEVIVVINRCTDRTEEIAREWGAQIVHEEQTNLSAIRNAGAKAARHEILVTCDADSVMGPHSLSLIAKKLTQKSLVGGGTVTLPERWSVGIFFSLLAVIPYLIWHGVSFGMFWCLRKDFEAIGGFDETLVSIEDLDFAKRMQAHGKQSGRKFGTLWKEPLITSCRKFDQFGDWYLFLNPHFVWRVFQGTDREIADRFWYQVGR